MSLEPLYTISNQSVGEAEFAAQITFDPAHDIFTGHFPGKPIVPGVCLLRIVKDMAGLISGKNVVLKVGSNIKFLHIIDPNQHAKVFLKGTFLSTEGNKLVINASLSAAELIFLKFKGTFELS